MGPVRYWTSIFRHRSSTGLVLGGLALGATAILVVSLTTVATRAQGRPDDAYHPPADPSYASPPPAYGNPPPAAGGGYGQNTYGQPQTYGQPAPYGQQPTYGQPQGYSQGGPPNGAAGYPQPQPNPQGYGNQGYAANNGAPYGQGPTDAYHPPYQAGPSGTGYGAPYSAPNDQGGPPPYDGPRGDGPTHGYYSQGEIADAGRGFFGSITKGLASAIEYTYQNVGRPNGYILGEDGGGAFFAGLRYGEGKLFTKDAGDFKVYWQGPSLGWDVGGEGSKIMILAYNLREPGEIYNRFGGIEGSTYLVGGVAVQLQKYGDVTLAIIRSGVGLRLGVNVGYLKYSRSPTWNPF